MTNNLSDATRLEIVLNHLHLTANRLSKILKYKSPASVYHILEGRNNLSPKMIEGIVKKFPQVNFKFLRSGQGEPILTNPHDQVNQKNLFSGILEDEESSSSTLNGHKKGKYGSQEQIELLIDQSKKTNVLLNALLEEIQHLNKKL